MTGRKEHGLFIPDSVTVGKFSPLPGELAAKTVRRDLSGRFGFVTCRFKYDQWVSPSVFERLTGYKPSNQRDRAAQLTKTVTDAVTEFPNDPVSGFRIVAWGKNPYRYSVSAYDYTGDIVVEDPRGFMMAFGPDSLFSVFARNGMNVEDGVIAGEFAYGWDYVTKTVTLVSPSEPGYAGWKLTSDGFREKAKPCFSISKKDLVPGRVYRAKKVLDGDWMYMGVRDTYSEKCHLAAFDAGGVYDVGKSVEDEKGQLLQRWRVNWPTTTGRMVFYSMKPRAQQYVVRSDVSGIFDSVVEPGTDGRYSSPDGSAYRMYSGDRRPVTFEAVEADMASNPGFNRIVFAPSPAVAELPLDAFAAHTLGAAADTPFPFKEYPRPPLLCRGSVWRKFTPFGYDAARKDWRVYDLSSPPPRSYCFGRRPGVDEIKASGARDVYVAYRPSYPLYRLENGADLAARFAVAFVPKAVRDRAGSFI